MKRGNSVNQREQAALEQVIACDGMDTVLGCTCPWFLADGEYWCDRNDCQWLHDWLFDENCPTRWCLYRCLDLAGRQLRELFVSLGIQDTPQPFWCHLLKIWWKMDNATKQLPSITLFSGIHPATQPRLDWPDHVEWARVNCQISQIYWSAASSVGLAVSLKDWMKRHLSRSFWNLCRIKVHSHGEKLWISCIDRISMNTWSCVSARHCWQKTMGRIQISGRCRRMSWWSIFKYDATMPNIGRLAVRQSL